MLTILIMQLDQDTGEICQIWIKVVSISPKTLQLHRLSVLLFWYLCCSLVFLEFPPEDNVLIARVALDSCNCNYIYIWRLSVFLELTS